MSRNSSLVRVGCALILSLLAASATSQASDRLLAGYEPPDDSCLEVTPGPNDPGLTVTWPVPGGVDGVPPATEGEHVLKMEWTNETDRKVEIRHDWVCSIFNLPGLPAGAVELQADVYIATPSALPQIVGIWDDVFGWIMGCPLPLTTNEWVTVSMYVGGLNQSRLDHIVAFLFENLAGDDGVIYVDNLRLISPRRITFAGYDWVVKSGNCVEPGPNNFSQSEDNVWVDVHGRLHLKITRRDGRWFSSEIVATEPLGYGTYVFTVESRIDSLDVNEVLGLFTWDERAPQYHYRELDFEFGRWGDPQNDNAQFVVQPWDTPGNMHRFNMDYSGSTEMTTHVMAWGSEGTNFMSYYGSVCSAPTAGDVIETWSYEGSDNPPPGDENVRINLWLLNGTAPSNGQEVEVVISDFRYSSVLPPDTDSDSFRDGCDNCPGTANSDQADGDGDGAGDLCDNCPGDANTDQLDADDDSQGDACEADDDNDGLIDDEDNCPNHANADQNDTDGDGAGDACDSNGGRGGSCAPIGAVTLNLTALGLLGLKLTHASSQRRTCRRKRR